MKLDELLFEEDIKAPKARNYVAKHSLNKSGAGRHVSKKGKHVPRQKQKRAWKREFNEALQ